MILYILAIPLFSFILPLASFWQMDDFSWGSTREIVGERGKRMVVHDEGKFDPSAIPLKTWQDFENELWEAGSNKSIGSLIEAGKRDDNDSRYGRESVMVPTRSAAFGGQPHAGQQSFRGSKDAFSNSGSAYGTVRGLTKEEGSQSGYFEVPQSQSPGVYGMQEYGGRPLTGYTVASTAYVPGTLPPDEVIQSDIQNLLAASNLQTLTKKGVRDELEARYAAPLGDRKQMVNQTIDIALGLI
jgi:chitin synthase